MLFFRSEAHLERWLVARGGKRGAVLTLADTWRLSKAWYPDRRLPTWKPRTRDESQRILDALDLDPGREFWTLK
jgi:Alkylmercury lyase